METTFILTAELDPDSFAWLDGLRREHFPAERNLLPAHLTIFHRLAPAQTARLGDFGLPNAPLPISLDPPVLLGSGVAIRISSPGLEQLRAAARDAMGGELSRQDSQSWRPHVTIQNKVVADTAQALHQRLGSGFKPRTGSVTGLLIWKYLGGPWRFVSRLPFQRLS